MPQVALLPSDCVSTERLCSSRPSRFLGQRNQQRQNRTGGMSGKSRNHQFVIQRETSVVRCYAAVTSPAPPPRANDSLPFHIAIGQPVQVHPGSRTAPGGADREDDTFLSSRYPKIRRPPDPELGTDETEVFLSTPPVPTSRVKTNPLFARSRHRIAVADKH